jgi:putative component of toxin-antitoxin plasmid stabilization module
MSLKPLLWVESALEDLRELPEAVRRRAGFELHQVQLGLAPSDWRPVPSVGPGVVELRIHAAGEHRVLYIARYAEAVCSMYSRRRRERSRSGTWTWPERGSRWSAGGAVPGRREAEGTTP